MSYHLPTNFVMVWTMCGLATRLTRIRLSLQQTPTVQAVVVRHSYAVPAALTSREQYMAACCCAGTSYGALWAVRGQGGRGRILPPPVLLLPGVPGQVSGRNRRNMSADHGVDEDDVRSAQATRRADPGATRRPRGVPASADSPPRHLQRPAQVCVLPHQHSCVAYSMNDSRPGAVTAAAASRPR
jgi:hypothetical protein